MQGASVKKTRKRFWPAGEDAGRRPKPVRVREANTRILRAKPQPKTDVLPMVFQLAMPSTNGFPHPRRIELYAGRGRKENASVTQSGTRFPNGSPGGNRIPESKLGMGYIFRMTPQVEAATRNRAGLRTISWTVTRPFPARRGTRPACGRRAHRCASPYCIGRSSPRAPR